MYVVSSFILLSYKLLFWEECSFDNSPIKPSPKQRNLGSLSLLLSWKYGKCLSKSRHLIRISKKRWSGHFNSQTIAIPPHFVLNVKLELFVVNAFLNLCQLNDIFQLQTLCRLIFYQSLENFTCAISGRSRDRSYLFDKQDLILDFESHHGWECVLGLRFFHKLDMDGSLELTWMRILDNVNVLDLAKDFANRLDHGKSVSGRKIGNLKLRV